jgi:hypothetical protein
MRDEADVLKIKQNLWRQGACLLVDATLKICTFPENRQELLSQGLYIVISHDCDILNPSLKKEPVVEVIKAEEITGDEYNGKFINGRNPRELHLKINQKNYRLTPFPQNRFFINRKYLETYSASQLEVEKPKVIINWICKRYRRHGFPDSFNLRCKKSKVLEEIQDIFKQPLAQNIRGLFFRINTDKELPANEPYKIILKMLVPKESYKNPKIFPELQDIFDKIVVLISKIKGVILLDCSQMLSMDEVTLHEYQRLKEWDFDYISFLNGEDGETSCDVVL